MKLIYLYHSGFALLGEGYTIIFDYFEDSASPSSGIVHNELQIICTFQSQSCGSF